MAGLTNARLDAILADGLKMWGGAVGIPTAPPQPEQGPAETPFVDRFDRSASVGQWAKDVTAAADRAGVPHDAALALVDVESGGDPSFKGPATPYGRAVGLTGTMSHHYLPGEDPHDPETNLTRGLQLLAHAQRQTGDWDAAAGRYAYGDNLHLPDAAGRTGHQYVRDFKAARADYARGDEPDAG